MPWAIKWSSENRLDGKREYLLGRYGAGLLQAPPHLAGYTKMVFNTRDAARKFIAEHYGYIRNRPDLRAEPHGLRVPVPVKVSVVVKEIEQEQS